MKIVTVTARQVGMLVGFAARRGLDVAAFLHQHGMTADMLTDGEQRLPHSVYAAAWREIPRQLGAEHLGLELAQLTLEQPPHTGLAILSYAASTSPTLGVAYETILRYLSIVHDGNGIRLESHGHQARFFVGPPVPIDIPPQAVVYLLASIFGVGRKIAAREWCPRVVRFTHAAPADTAPLRRFFHAPLEFECSVSEVVFDREVLDLPVAGTDGGLYSLIQEQADDLLARAPTQRMSDRVRQYLFASPTHKLPELGEVARQLATSVRSLQRMLQAEGVSYREVLDDVRRELALRHMNAHRLNVPEIAFLLGFSDTTSFHRAFRRWTGKAPGEYRRTQFSPGAAGQLTVAVTSWSSP